jgi:serine-type D-Ala-D-Ala carboxypeptidase (penicillin-binding protein 5/6)
MIALGQRARRAAAAGALAIAVLAFAVALRLATQGTPLLSIRRTLAADVRVPGTAPVLAWPRAGQAAVEVEGIGGVASTARQTPVPIASVAKVMTAYLTLREHPLPAGKEGFAITVTPADVAEEEQRASLLQSIVAVRAGERITERQALQALLLPSANNVAALLAVHDAGTLAAFVARMNSTARALGMDSTTYTDPSGFNDETVSTAVDQLKLARVAMHEPEFAAIVDESTAELPVAGRVANYDTLLGRDGYVGVKTGSDRAAGGCFVFDKQIAVGAQRLTVLGVVLGQREGSLVEAALISAQRLGDSVAATLRVQTVLPAGTSVLHASNADGDLVTIATAHALSEIGWGGLELPVTLRVRVPTTRLRAGERVASVSVDGAISASTAAVATHALAGPSLGWRLEHLL